ncbi:MAG: hypothetical protein IJ639_02800 [Ruminococcus sp.]|nr:hypothetical protein [Ruminococcus sp.]
MAIVYFVPIALFLLVMLFFGGAAAFGGGIFTYNVINTIWLPLIFVLVIAHVAMIVFIVIIFTNEYKRFKRNIASFISGLVFIILSEIIRAFISIMFFACVLRGFVNSVEAHEGDMLYIAVLFFLFLGDVLVGVLVLGVSSVIIPFGYTSLFTETTIPCVLLGIVTLLVSITVFLLVQHFLIVGFYHETGAYFCESLGLPNELATKSILYAIFGGT